MKESKKQGVSWGTGSPGFISLCSLNQVLKATVAMVQGGLATTVTDSKTTLSMWMLVLLAWNEECKSCGVKEACIQLSEECLGGQERNAQDEAK